MQETIEQVIANIRARNVELSVEGDKIIANRPLHEDEKEVLKENRAAAIAIINATPETPEAKVWYERGQKIGYAAGIRDAAEQFRSNPPTESKLPAPAPTTPEEEIAKLSKVATEQGRVLRAGARNWVGTGSDPGTARDAGRGRPNNASVCLFVLHRAREWHRDRIQAPSRSREKMNRPPTWS